MHNIWKKPDLLVLTGSHLYGCAVETSDEDTRGFVVEPVEFLLGRKSFEQHETRAPQPDCVIWGFKKFFKLLEGFSPNTAEILFAPEQNIRILSPLGKMMIDHRHLFVAKRLVKPMQGFALSEWKKAVEFHDHLRKLGSQRKEHIAVHGYSIKNAYHAIRLLEECIELLKTGTITFPRPNADFLRQVRHGLIEESKLKEIWESLDKQIPDLIASSSLPEDVDRDKLDNLYYTVVREKLVSFMESQYGLASVDIALAAVKSMGGYKIL